MSGYSSSSSTTYSLKDDQGNQTWSATASGTATGPSQSLADASLNKVMYGLLLTLLSKGLNRIYSSVSGCDWCGQTSTTTCDNCITNTNTDGISYGSTSTYTYEGMQEVWSSDSSTLSQLIGYVYYYTVKENSCSGAQQVDQEGKKIFCFESAATYSTNS
jgi:hypothetical protein